MRLSKRNTPTQVVDLNRARSHCPDAPLSGGDRDQAAAARDASASHRDRIVVHALHDFLAVRELPGLEESVGARNWPAMVQHLLQTAASDRQRAADDRAAAAEDRRVAARDRAYASRDDLTGAWRRDAGLRVLNAEMNRAERSGSSLVIGYLDIAGFKAINDAYGHSVGDRTLADVVGTLHVQLRSYDSVIRMGGDEFVCILPETPLSAARRRLEQLRQKLRALEPPITVRVGLASMEPEDTGLMLLARADDALLAARGLPPAMHLVER
jgi:diguanylate cyclase (GGDEF)-like protein